MHRRKQDCINDNFGSVISMISCIQWTSEDVINVNVLLWVLYEHKRDFVGQKQLDVFFTSSLGKKKVSQSRNWNICNLRLSLTYNKILNSAFSPVHFYLTVKGWQFLFTWIWQMDFVNVSLAIGCFLTSKLDVSAKSISQKNQT